MVRTIPQRTLHAGAHRLRPNGSENTSRSSSERGSVSGRRKRRRRHGADGKTTAGVMLTARVVALVAAVVKAIADDIPKGLVEDSQKQLRQCDCWNFLVQAQQHHS